jgi:hypothetical protein
MEDAKPQDLEVKQSPQDEAIVRRQEEAINELITEACGLIRQKIYLKTSKKRLKDYVEGLQHGLRLGLPEPAHAYLVGAIDEFVRSWSKEQKKNVG